ncbi:phthiocerol/phthiodiolone dimycocerosyl transferase family protein [Mycobacterium sp.]|uniref:phthiocerol/phthiodiolone dimycocerosyl transferase family protein n=1 Tax=Mycobacterium sp. TaxID=1785 RepID=UPI003BA95387
MRCFVNADAEVPFLSELPSQEIPSLEVRPLEESSLREEYCKPLRTGGPLVRAVLLQGSPASKFVFCGDHIAGDGVNLLAIYRNLLLEYDRLLKASRRSIIDSSPSVFDNAPDSWDPERGLWDKIAEGQFSAYQTKRIEEATRQALSLPYQHNGKKPPEPGVCEGERVDVARISFPDSDSQALRLLARERNTSLHGLVCAAVIFAIRKLLGKQDSNTMACTSPINLRPFLGIGNDVIHPCVSTHFYRAEVSPESDPFDFAKSIRASLVRTSESDEKFYELLLLLRAHELPFHKLTQIFATSAYVSNLGAWEMPRDIGGLKVENLRFMPFRESYHLKNGTGPVMATVASLNGELSIELPHCVDGFSTSFMTVLAAEISKFLTGFIRER